MLRIPRSRVQSHYYLVWSDLPTPSGVSWRVRASPLPSPIPLPAEFFLQPWSESPVAFYGPEVKTPCPEVKTRSPEVKTRLVNRFLASLSENSTLWTDFSPGNKNPILYAGVSASCDPNLVAPESTLVAPESILVAPKSTLVSPESTVVALESTLVAPELS